MDLDVVDNHEHLGCGRIPSLQVALRPVTSYFNTPPSGGLRKKKKKSHT